MIDLLKQYDRAVPRYTSYPTAPNFSEKVSHDSYISILNNVSEKESVSLYIHIPFCKKMCTYCGCNTQIVDHNAPINSYIGTLKREIKLVSSSLGRKQKVSYIHFGGGTPNFVPIKALESLLKALRTDFSLDEGIIIAMEIDPRLLTLEQAHALIALGVNRISMGVQEFDSGVQEAINRIQPFEMVRDCVEWFRSEGIESINFDMIYGLPLQTTEIMQNSMKLLNDLKPERVALFGYAHVPWFKEAQKKLEKFKMPDVYERYEMAENSRKFLIDNGYVAIGIDHFALPNDELAIAMNEKKLHRNFQGYTTDKERVLIGLGQSSISDYGNAYVQNTTRNKEYRERVNASELPIVKTCNLSDEDMYRRAVIEQIMCYQAVDINTVNNADTFSTKVWTQALPLLEGYKADGLVDVGDMQLKITEQGRVFTRLIASAFDAYLKVAEGKHARAV